MSDTDKYTESVVRAILTLKLHGPYGEPVDAALRVVMSDYAALSSRLEAERHTCPGCNHLATLLVNADACPLKWAGDEGCVDRNKGYTACADEDTADCVARIVAWEEGL